METKVLEPQQVNGYTKKVVIVGPVLPYRGGIAQHTTMLHRSLSKCADLLTVSFTRQYPRWLFPGKNDRDPDYKQHHETGVEYIIDSVNIFTWRLACKRIISFKPDSVVFPWWHIYWFPLYYYLIKKFKKKDIKIVFMCHNAIEHETSFIRKKVILFLFRLVDRFVVHTSIDKKNLMQLEVSAAIDVYPIPIFDQYPKATTKLPRRAELELLFLGFVRPYKGLNILLDAMTRVKTKDVFLTIAGEFWGGLDEAKTTIKMNGLIDKIEIIPSFQPEDEVANLVTRADVVVLPYLNATGSAIVPLAYHYNKPVIASRVGGLPDVIINGETGILITPGSVDELTEAILYALSNKSWYSNKGIQKMKKIMSWEGLSNIILKEGIL